MLVDLLTHARAIDRPSRCRPEPHLFLSFCADSRGPAPHSTHQHIACPPEDSHACAYEWPLEPVCCKHSHLTTYFTACFWVKMEKLNLPLSSVTADRLTAALWFLFVVWAVCNINQLGDSSHLRTFTWHLSRYRWLYEHAEDPDVQDAGYCSYTRPHRRFSDVLLISFFVVLMGYPRQANRTVTHIIKVWTSPVQFGSLQTVLIEKSITPQCSS